MASKKVIGIGSLILIILATSLYIQLGTDVSIKVTCTSATFSINESGNMIVTGVEKVALLNGTKTIAKTGCVLSNVVYPNGTVIYSRLTNYGQSTVILDKYVFDANQQSLEIFPVSHDILATGADGFKVKYVVSGAYYDGTAKTVTSPLVLGKRMKLEWDTSDVSSAKITKSTLGKATVTIMSPVQGSSDTFTVRFFDPFTSTKSCGRFICGNDTYTGGGNLSGKTWAAIQDTWARNYHNNTHGWNQSLTLVNGSTTYLWMPWYASSTNISEGNLKDTYTQSLWGINATWANNTAVTDETSETAIASVMNWSGTTLQRFINYLDVCADRDSSHVSQGPWLTSWVCTQNSGNITKNDQNSASDATSRFAIALFMACKNPDLNASMQQMACDRAMNITRAALAEEWVTSCQNSTVNTSQQLCAWHLAGAGQAWGGGALTQVGQQMFFGYHESNIMANLAAYAYSHNASYSNAARNETHQYLFVNGFKNKGNTSGDFNYTTGGAHYYLECTAGNCSAKTQSGSDMDDDADSVRRWQTCNNVEYANITYATFGEPLPWEFVALRNYCQAWTSRMGPVAYIVDGGTAFANLTSACYRMNNGSTGLCDTTGIIGTNTYFGAGLVSNLVARQDNETYFNAFVAGSLSTYSNVSDTYGTESAFGIYNQVRYLHSIRSATGYYDFIFKNATYNFTAYATGMGTSGGGGGGGGSGTNISLFVNGSFQNLSLELNTPVNVSANDTNATSTVCLDIYHPSYGVNYTCGIGKVSAIVNYSYVEKKLLNDSSLSKNITVNATLNGSFGVTAHALDEPVRLSFNVRGFSSNGTFPNNVKVYVNGSLSNTIGLVINTSSSSLNAFNDTTTSKTLNFSLGTSQIVGYLRLPQVANVTSASITLTGGNSYSLQEEENNFSNPSGGVVYENYTKPSSASNTSLWQVKAGVDGSGAAINYSIPIACWNANETTLNVRLASRHRYTDTGNDYVNVSCWNATGWSIVMSAGPSCSGCTHGSASSVAYVHDGSYATFAIYDVDRGWTDSVSGGSGSTFGLSLWEDAIYWSQKPENPWVEVGTVDGAREWSHPGTFNFTNTTGNLSSAINTFLASCTADDEGYCAVPIYAYSEGGSILFANISVNYTGGQGIVVVSIPLVSGFLNRSANAVNIPLKVSSTTNGILEVSNLTYWYRGGNNTIVIAARDNANTVNVTVNLTTYHSGWNYTLPNNLQYFEFIPKTPTTKNVTPYGQAIKPILNITGRNTGGIPLNFSIFLNESYSCVNLSAGITPNASNATLLRNNTWIEFKSGVTTNQTFGIWMWANYSCNTSTWLLWQPELSFRACASGLLCSAATG